MYLKLLFMSNVEIQEICNDLSKAIETFKTKTCTSSRYNTMNESIILSKCTSNVYNLFKQLSCDPNIFIKNQFIPPEFDNVLSQQLKKVISCLQELIETIKNDLVENICKFFINDKQMMNRFSYVYNITPLSIDDLIGYTIYYKLYKYKKHCEHEDVIDEINNIIKTNKNNKYLLLFDKPNSIKHAQIERSIKVLPNIDKLYNSIRILLNIIKNKYKNIDMFIKSFITCNPKLINKINIICEESLSSDRCRGGESEISFNVDNFIKLSEMTEDIFTHLMKLSTLIKKLNYTTQLVNNTNEINTIILFLHFVSLIIYHDEFIELKSDKFNKFIDSHVKHELIVNNCVHVNTFKTLYNNIVKPNINNDFLSNKISREVNSLQSSDETFIEIYKIDHDIIPIILIMGIYSSYLYTL
jgi:hypothetical protein